MLLVLASGCAALTFGVLGSAPVPSTAKAARPALVTWLSDGRTWHATVRCQLIRIKDNNALSYATGTGAGPNPQAAVLVAKQNVLVPPGHYKRHCQTLYV
jgi:hypothetical protein